MRTRKFLLVFFLFVIMLQLFGQEPLTELPIGEKIIIQSAIDYGYSDNGYWNYLSDNQVMLNRCDSSGICQFILKESSDKGYYEIFTGKGEPARIGFYESGDSVSQLFFHHICDGLFKIYDRQGKVISLGSSGRLITRFDNNGAESCWYLIDANTKKIMVYTDDTLIAERPNRKRSEFYAQIRANYYQYGTKVPLFFERLSFLDLRCKEYGEIALALNDCTSIMDQAERTILVLKGASKNPDKYARRYIYSEIEKVNFRRPNILSKATIERYFAEQTPETDPELMAMVERIKKKMLSGLSLRVR